MFGRLTASLLSLLATITVPLLSSPAPAETFGPAANAPCVGDPAGDEGCGRQPVFQQGESRPRREGQRLVFQRACPPSLPVAGVECDPYPSEEQVCGDDVCEGSYWGEETYSTSCWPNLSGLCDSVSAYGWLSQGFTWNSDTPADRFNGPLTFNDRSNEYQMNQLYVVLERPVAEASCGWDIGGRVDLLYGTDYFFTQSVGLETRQDGSPHWNSADGPRGAGAALYGLAMPQLYAEVSAPIGAGATIKMGHFYSILGYESVMDPENFFYSRSYMRQYAEPFTHTGFLVSYALAPRWQVQGGMSRGWNTWEDPNGQQGFLGGLQWTCPDGRSLLGFALHTGREDPAGQENRTVYSLTYQHHVTSRLVYVLQHDLGVEAGAATNQDFEPDTAKWYGIAQYLMYTFTPTMAGGFRVEWFHDQDNARVLGIPLATLSEGGHYVDLTLGMNWKPRQNVTLRSEVRYDRSDVNAPALHVGGMYDDFQDKDQLTWATNLIVLF